MRRIMLVIAYDGTAYCGWQIQNNAVTVEEKITNAIAELTGETIELIGASRTDAGVHACGNVAVFDTDSRIPADKFSYALNQRLPEDIVIQSSSEVALNFHPRHCDSRKTYEYKILNARHNRPLLRRYTYFVHQLIDVERMKQAAIYLIGEHDFKSFCSTHTQAKTTVRTIYYIDITQNADVISIKINGNGFLYNMVRIIVGTLLEVGMGMREPKEMKDILDKCDREAAGPTAPAIGLTLLEIKFDKE